MSVTRSRLQSAFRLRSSEIGGKVVSGATYQVFGMILRTVVSVGSTAVLARLLVPGDFGYVAMAMVVTEFAVLFADFGLTNVLIQRRRIGRLHVDSVFWASLFLGGLLTVAVFLASFLTGVLFTDPLVGDLLRALSLTFALGALGTIPHVVLARLMRFDLQFLTQAITITARAAIAIAAAWHGLGVWSLVVGSLGGAVIQVFFGLWLVPYRPRLRFDPTLLLRTWRTNGSYFAGGLMYYAGTNLDLIVVGRHMGPVALGYYQSARSLTDEIRARLAVPLQHVLFPALSALQSERERMQTVALKSGRLLASIVLPVGFGVSAVASELVPVLYGAQWLPMVPLVSMFGLSAGLKASTVISGPIFNSLNQVTRGLKHGVVGISLMLAGLWYGASQGVEAVAYAIALTSVYVFVPYIEALRLIGLGVRDAWNILGRPLLAASVMWACVAAARIVTEGWTANPLSLLMLHVLLGAAVYPVVLHALSPQYARDFREFFSRLDSARKSGARA